MRKYGYYLKEYQCHPETCCHEEHYKYYVYSASPLKLSLGGHKYGVDQVLLESDSVEECQDFLSQYSSSLGLKDPWEIY